MDFEESEDVRLLRKSVSELVRKFPVEYWTKKDEEEEFPREFWDELGKQGWLGINIPEEHGGSGLGLSETAAVVREVARSGAGIAGANLFTLAPVMTSQTILDFGHVGLQEKYLPKLAKGELVCSFGLTEPDAGVNSFDIRTFAREDNGEYVINGQKVWTTLAHVSDLMILVARTTKKEDAEKRTLGLTLFAVDVDDRIKVNRLRKMPMKPLGSNEVFFEDLRVPEESIIGVKDEGWRPLLSLLNAERISTASMSIGTGDLVLDRAVNYAKERVVFGRPIGMNQGIQFPLAHCKAELESAWLMTQKAAWLFDNKKECGFECNVAAYMGTRAAFNAADRAIETYGGMGFAHDYDIERHFRDVRLFRTAPIPEEMVLNYIGQHVLGLPRSY